VDYQRLHRDGRFQTRVTFLAGVTFFENTCAKYNKKSSITEMKFTKHCGIG
jgi:hypothetical protein